MSDIRIVRDYLHPPATVWRAVTDPALIPLWTATGAGGRPEGFAPTVGTKFRFVAKPKPGWNGVVDCEVLEVSEPSLLRYSWTDTGSGHVTEVTYRLEPHADGTRFSYEHTGFVGVSGTFMAWLLGRVRTKMLTVGLPAVLNELDDNGVVLAAGTLRPKPSLERPSSPTWQPACSACACRATRRSARGRACSRGRFRPAA